MLYKLKKDNNTIIEVVDSRDKKRELKGSLWK